MSPVSLIDQETLMDQVHSLAEGGESTARTGQAEESTYTLAQIVSICGLFAFLIAVFAGLITVVFLFD